jgi:hypothetical protein
MSLASLGPILMPKMTRSPPTFGGRCVPVLGVEYVVAVAQCRVDV